MNNDTGRDAIRQENGGQGAGKPAVRFLSKRVRVRKEDSAFIYFILESQEGVVAYSTLEHEPGDPHRDLEIFIPPDFREEAERVLASLGGMIYELA
jgi:hypothetical protein